MTGDRFDQRSLLPALTAAGAGVLLIVLGRLLERVDDNLADLGDAPELAQSREDYWREVAVRSATT